MRLGLTVAEVNASRAKYGANRLTPPPREPWWRLYLAKFDDPVIRILLIAAVVAIIVGAVDGHYAEGIGILVAVGLATGLAFLNEFRAEREFELLNRSSDDLPVKVLRDGGFTVVPRQDVVVGELVQVETGDEIPADGHLLEATALQVSEGRLTGESRPVRKSPTSDATDAEHAYAPNHLLRGTNVADGVGLMEVTAVGDATEIGRTARAAAEETHEQTPLDRQLERLSRLIGVGGLGIAAATFAALVIRGATTGDISLTAGQWYFVILLIVSSAFVLSRAWLPILIDGLEMLRLHVAPPHILTAWRGPIIGMAIFIAGITVGWFAGWLPSELSDWLPRPAARELLTYFMVAVTIIVVAVPEGLAMSVTLTLAYAMRKMTASNNLVRRLHACETIGAVTVICSDKTGTLTFNEMRVGDVHWRGADDLIAEAIAANTTAHVSGETGEPIGNPTEGALLVWLRDQGKDYAAIRRAFATEHQWPFQTERKFMATLGRSAVLGQRILHVKGAPEILLSRCALPESERELLLQAMTECQRRGMRTLGFAYAAIDDQAPATELNDLATGMTWMGFVAIADPVRPDVPNAIAACRRAGVAVKIVTGDTVETAREIARQAGLGGTDTGLITGAEFAQLSDEAASATAGSLSVMARARPADKLRLVRLLKERGEVVAVTGDGVNDGPALNYADVGLAMGKTGTAVAKEASDIILLDDSFTSIVTAILWGRSLYENIQKFILFQLTINVAALGLALMGPFVGVKLPLTVMQMLWINLIMDTFAALALATEPPNLAVLDRPPRDPKAFIVTPAMARLILVTAGLFLAMMAGLIFWLGREASENRPTREGTLIFTAFVLLQFWNLFNARRLGSARSAFQGLFSNWIYLVIAAAILIGQIVLVQLGGAAFRTVPLDWTAWLWLIAGTAPVIVVGEVQRMIHRRRHGLT